MKKIFFICPVLFVTITTISCKPKYKNPFSDDIVGKWKLVEVEISRTTNYQPYEHQSAIIDCLNANIIYDFQPNNKFVITNFVVDTFFIADTTVIFSSLFDSFNEGEHFYEYHKFPDPPGDPGPNLCIDKPNIGEYDKKCFFCDVRIGKQTMTISTGQPDGNRFGCTCKLIILK